MNNKLVTVVILIVLTFSAVLVPLDVLAELSDGDVYISQITPESSTGTVGSRVNVVGHTFSPNGSYQIVFGKTVVATGKAEGHSVNANFTVPELAAGSYALIFRDTAININYSSQFAIQTGFAINAVPSAVQEGSTVQFNITVTGGAMGVSYFANIGVALPGEYSPKYSKIVPLGLANPKGTTSVLVSFPDSSFTPIPDSSALNYPGTYTIYFNQSQSLAQNDFSVNILDSTTYHRGDTVSVRAMGYQPNQAATITVTSTSGGTVGAISVTASSDGTITASWVVPSDVPIGDYTLKINPEGTAKQLPDFQRFTIPGYAVKVQTTNLAGVAASGLLVQAKDVATSSVYSSTNDVNGVANLRLEKGGHSITVIMNDLVVGHANITVSEDSTFIVQCELTDLKVTVRNSHGIAIPFVTINVELKAGSKTTTATDTTSPQGSCIFNSTLLSATYTIEATMYGKAFNSGNTTVSNLPSQAINEVVIICPDKNVSLTVVGYGHGAIPNARVELVEVSNGLFYSANTDGNGELNSLVTFGTYRVRIYKENVLVNETTLQVFNSVQQQIRCTLYGIKVDVTVVDFFGIPVSNVEVTLNGPQTESLMIRTKSNGVATFDNIIGGNLQVIAQAQGVPESYQALTLTVNQPTTVQVKLEKYVTLGSLLVPAATLLTIIIVLVAVMLFVLLELFLKRRNKPKTTPPS